MSDNQVSDVLAQAFAAEGTDILFTLMGDANMYWSAAMADSQGTRLVHARHEHCAVAMADGYARATGKVGVASVTCGPGYTQIMTALTMAARGNIPLVVFAGDAPIGASWYVQEIDQAPLALATGAAFVPIRTVDRALDNVREAFYLAASSAARSCSACRSTCRSRNSRICRTTRRRPIWCRRRSARRPTRRSSTQVVAMIAEAERPVVIAGRGAIWSGAKAALETLAEESGALLATSLLGKGLFEGNPFNLDIAGTFASDLAREYFAESDLVIGVGAGLGHYHDRGRLSVSRTPRSVRIDVNPKGLVAGAAHRRPASARRCAGRRRGDHRPRMRARGVRRPGWRSNEVASRIAADNPDSKEYSVTPGTLDPRPAVRELDAVVPKDWEVIVAGGHCANFVSTHLRGRAGGKYHFLFEFGAIGSGLSAAIGVAAAKGDGKVLLVDGDGSIMQHIQELETIRRHGIELLICVLNDGGYGAEIA